MRITLLSSCVLLSAVGASAQVVSSGNLVGGAIVAGSSSSAPVLPGTDIWPGFARSANGYAGSAAVSLANQMTNTAIQLDWQLDAQSWSAGSSVAELDAHYTFSSTALQRGHLVVDWTPSAVGTGQASLSIDLFADGYVDAQGAAVIPVTFHQAPLVIRVHAEVEAQAGSVSGPWGSSWSWTGAANAALRVRFVPSHAAASVVANQPCSSAALLQVLPNLHEGAELFAEVSDPFDFGLFALGFASMDVLLPGLAQCHLLLDPALVVAQPIPANRIVSHSIQVPAAVRPAAFLAQFVALDPAAMSLVASDALSVAIQ